MNSNESNKELKVSEVEVFKKSIVEEFKNINFKLETITDDQINILNIDKNILENTKLIKSKEEIIINYYNKDITKKNFNINELQKKIINNLDIVITNLKAINNYKIRNININPSQDYKPVESLYNKYVKIYKNSVEQLIHEIKELIFLLKSVDEHLKNLNNFILENKSYLENLVNGKEVVDAEKVTNEIFASYANCIEYFEKYKEKLNNVLDFISKRNESKKLKTILDKINNAIDANNIKIPKINIDLMLNGINLFEQLKEKNYIKNLYIQYNFIEQMKFNVLFIFDITSSMGKYIEILKENYERIIKEIKINCPLALLYIGFIGYKDLSDLITGDEYVDLNFTLYYENLFKQIKIIHAEGGGDIPEDVSGAFEMALNKRWNKGTNIIFFITDSPCHGINYHDLDQKVEYYIDQFPKEIYDGEYKIYERKKMEDLVEQFVKNDFHLICYEINEITMKMFKMFEEKYKSHNKHNFFSITKEDLSTSIIRIVCELYKIKEGDILNNLKQNERENKLNFDLQDNNI